MLILYIDGSAESLKLQKEIEGMEIDLEVLIDESLHEPRPALRTESGLIIEPDRIRRYLKEIQNRHRQ